MKNILLIIIFSSLVKTHSVSDKNSEVDNCRKFKTGRFIYHFKSNDKILFFTLTRSDSTQIEKNEQNGYTSKFKINWIDNCTYELKFLEGTEKLATEMLNMKKKMIVRTTILGSGKNYYLFKSTSNISTNLLQDTVWTTK